MANKKEIKTLKVPKAKGNLLLNFILKDAVVSDLKMALELADASIYRLKDKIKEEQAIKSADEIISELFTITKYNNLARLYNCYLEDEEIAEHNKTLAKEKAKEEIDKQKNIAASSIEKLGFNPKEVL